MPGRTSPLEKFGQAVAKCSVESAAYGKCVVGEYQNVRKDMCVQEFMRLKNCYLR
ncbi:putative mitochondrial respiratory chain complex I assembly protein [Elsinoe australis]|uniref:Putative mitochondrial respiratory chain complex I assembly protein n=1 Tax=Elsinoe australis TaxID=40998 RepID=A0A4U7AX15_9PEZI|nr:putative mitochondrial respiratory chain complex I assembly protein [Elsinoe australis]